MTVLSEAEVIAEAKAAYGSDMVIETLLDALLAIHGNGFSDEQVGDMGYAEGHVFRVDRWLVWTDDRGFDSVEEFANRPSAEEAFLAYCDRLNRLEAVEALTDSAYELGREGRLADPSDDDVLIYAAELAESETRGIEFQMPDLAKLEP